MPQKKWKFNIIDIIAIVLIAAVVFFVASKLLSNRGGGRGMGANTHPVLAGNQPGGA